MTISTPPTKILPFRTLKAVRIWYGFIAVDVVIAFVIQVVLILTGGPDPNTGETIASVGIATRIIQTLSFFTIQSNLLVLIFAVTMVIKPQQRGRLWRILHLDALLGITITGLVFDLVLIHYVHPSGWQLLATIGFHYIAPWATLLGWLLIGPRLRLDRRTITWAVFWPIAWIVYTFTRGALVNWYPYPFINVDEVGLGVALRNTMIIVVLAVILVVIFWATERKWLHRNLSEVAPKEMA